MGSKRSVLSLNVTLLVLAVVQSALLAACTGR
jgi:hypothetical protein